MQGTPSAEHQWLQKLVGNWTHEMEAMMGPDQPPMKSTDRNTVRSLGGFWTIDEGECEMPGGDVGTMIMSLGYDPEKSRYIGTFMGSMMAQLWVYEGAVDASGRILTLDTIGPNFAHTGLAKYKDILEFITDDHRTLTSQVEMEDGSWMKFMTAHYYRQPAA